MPYINIKITRERVTAEQKTALIDGATQLLVDVLGKDPSTTVVIVDEIEIDNWGIGGLPVSQYREQKHRSGRSSPAVLED